MRIVFLSPVPANASIKSIVNQSLYRDAITFIHGSPLLEHDMARARLEHAAAAFIIPDRNASDYQDESDKVTLRALAFDNYAPDTPLYVYNLLVEMTALQEKITTASICLDSLKQMLLAYNCIYRGTGTILINLLRQISTRDSYDEPWQAQYGDGAGNKIFSSDINPVFIGKTFSYMASYLYAEYQVIFFAVTTKVFDRRHFVINPGKKFILRESDECYFMASQMTDIQAISKLVSSPLF